MAYELALDTRKHMTAYFHNFFLWYKKIISDFPAILPYNFYTRQNFCLYSINSIVISRFQRQPSAKGYSCRIFHKPAFQSKKTDSHKYRRCRHTHIKTNPVRNGSHVQLMIKEQGYRETSSPVSRQKKDKRHFSIFISAKNPLHRRRDRIKELEP